MPQQEVYFEQKAGERLVEVLKVYDRNYARDAFANMAEGAQKYYGILSASTKSMTPRTCHPCPARRLKISDGKNYWRMPARMAISCCFLWSTK
jgi:hypothetical protein